MKMGFTYSIVKCPGSHFIQMDEIKAKDRIIFSLEKELETQTGYVQKLQLQKEALDEQLFLVKEAECNMSSPKREIPGRAGDGSEHCSSPVSPLELRFSNSGVIFGLAPKFCYLTEAIFLFISTEKSILPLTIKPAKILGPGFSRLADNKVGHTTLADHGRAAGVFESRTEFF